MQTNMSTAQALKQQGNLAHKAGQYEEAVKLYSEAIELDDTNAVLFSNRSLSRLLLGQHKEALSDAEQACKLKHDWEKGHFRRGAALEAMGDLAKALPAYETALELKPMSSEISDKVRQLKKRVRPAPKPKAKPKPKTHSMPAGINIQQVPAGGFGPPSASAWAQGLSPAKQAEWLVDCYRMRVDDDYAWGGCNLHGLYAVSTGDCDRPKDTICEDFLLFCKLAVAHGVVPPRWDWTKFLNTAAGLLPFAFEKDDAHKKWGGENVFSALTGGRSLRYTAEVVYGMSCMANGQKMVQGGDDGAALEALSEQVEGQWRQLVKGTGEVFAEVGGVALWKQLHSALVIEQAYR